MKSGFHISRLLLIAVACMPLTGCLFRSATVPARHFVLAPIPATEPVPAASGHLSVGIGFVNMPSYLVRNSMVVRHGTNEIEYLEDALWAERLDHCFQQTLAANLSRLLPSDTIYLSDWGRDQAQARVFITVEQFDVDASGRGTLIAQWRITAPDSDKALKTGHAQLVRTGASPRGHPEVNATTLSDLAAEFSRELAQAIRESSIR